MHLIRPNKQALLRNQRVVHRNRNVVKFNQPTTVASKLAQDFFGGRPLRQLTILWVSLLPFRFVSAFATPDEKSVRDES